MYIIYGQFKNSPVRFANVKVFSMDLTLWILGEVTTDRIKETSETICSLAFPLWIGRSWIKKAFPELWSGSLQASSDFVSFPPSFINSVFFSILAKNFSSMTSEDWLFIMNNFNLNSVLSKMDNDYLPRESTYDPYPSRYYSETYGQRERYGMPMIMGPRGNSPYQRFLSNSRFSAFEKIFQETERS